MTLPQQRPGDQPSLFKHAGRTPKGSSAGVQ